LAIAIEEAPAAGVKRFVVFDDDDRFLYRIQCRSATVEHTPASSNRVAHTVQVGLDHVVRNGPGATVDEQNGIRRQRDSSRTLRTVSKQSSIAIWHHSHGGNRSSIASFIRPFRVELITCRISGGVRLWRAN